MMVHHPPILDEFFSFLFSLVFSLRCDINHNQLIGLKLMKRMQNRFIYFKEDNCISEKQFFQLELN